MCLRSPFPRLLSWILSSFWFLPSSGWPSFVWVLYRVRFVLSFCLFVFPLMGNSCLLMIGLVFLFCLFFRWGILHRVLLMVGWCQILYSSGFPCVSSHYLILHKVTSLVVQGLGVSAPTPKAQGLISVQDWKFHKWFVVEFSLVPQVRLKQIPKNEKPKMNPRQMAVTKSGK